MRDPSQHFLAIVGASGTGKSSLVYAGVIPRLAEGAIEGSRQWRVASLTPGKVAGNPFLGLAAELTRFSPAGPSKTASELAIEFANSWDQPSPDAGFQLPDWPSDA